MSTDDSNERRSNEGRSGDRAFDRGRPSRGDGSSSRADRPARRDGENAGRPRRDGDRPVRRDGDRPVRRDGDRPVRRDRESRPFPQDGDRPFRRDGDRPVRRDGDRPVRRDGESRPFRQDGDRPFRRDGDRPVRRDGDRPVRRDGESRPFRQDGDRPFRRDGDRPVRRDGDRPFRRDGDRPVRRDGESRPYRQDGDRPARRDGERPVRGDGESRPYRQDGDRPFRRDGDRPSYRGGDGRPARRDGAERGFTGGDRRPSRDSRPGAGAPRRFDRDDARATRPPQDRRERGPELPEDVTAFDLPGAARNELKTLSKDNADNVARHLAMAARVIDEDPALAHQHALAASRSAGRVGVVRETVAITAYAVGDFALALRELRTHRRITGSDEQLPLIVDSERGVGRPDRALEEGRAVDRSTLSVPVRVQLAIAMSGARLDLGQTDRALQELEIPEADPDRAFEWSPALFSARAAVLEELGRDAEAAEWQRRADIAAEALDAAAGVADREVIVVEEIDLIDDEGGVDVASGVIPVDDVDEDDVADESDEPVDDAGDGDVDPAEPDAGADLSDEEASVSDEDAADPDARETASDDEVEGSR
ncbi:primosomal protein [Microbacterium sp. KSW2-29]|uniref:Primosomal protein n=1 Tax=Microbacterium phycohabitans TaxID=3075993 RepID=A0ABU3SQ68_9MICO|nr:primosomal protein [Microbacterium sp. KSW2-29]MDU0346958.1 primosomal protein [Microbacterium sp. KSW2-29]